jgi:hypothetical protein
MVRLEVQRSGMPMRRWSCHHPRARTLGITLLILSLVHAPWPQADFHNVRHHDQPGQVCEHHDHLLRWHPDAGQADDVALLHWHWVLPTSGPLESGHHGDGPALHAHVSGWDATSPDSGPLVVPDRSSRPVDAPPPSLLALEAAPFARPADRPGLREGLGSVRTFGATFSPRISLASRLQRWSC